MKKIISGVFAFLVAVSTLMMSCAPAFASTDVEYMQTTNFFHWSKDVPIWGDFISYISPLTCPYAEDGHHRASTYQSINIQEGYFNCVCSLCGDTFTAYESDLQQSYDAQVEELPATGITSSGGLIWHSYSSFSGTGGYGVTTCSGGTKTFFVLSDSLPFVASNLTGAKPIKYLLDTKNLALLVSTVEDKSYFCPGVSFDVVVPISGSYRRIESPRFKIRSILSSSGEQFEVENIFEAGTSFTHYSLGDSFSIFNIAYYSGDSQSVSSASGLLFFPYYEIIPDSTIDATSSGDTYNIQSRPTSITGDYGIIGDNGQITKVDGDYIVNETTNTYQNPATGTTTPILDWSYDYGDRTYSLTLEGELSAEVQYGDDHITINETNVNDTGDTVTNNYTIYYLVDGGGSGTEDPDPSPSPSPSDPPACVHTWTETSRTEPTCTTAGKVTSACSKCNQTKAETIPATGHTWVVERTVQTSYDEEGNLLQQGYTIYKCSVCGEEYKDMEGTGPPGEEEKKSIWEKLGDLIGSIFGGIGELIEAVLGKLLDALQSLADMLMGKLKSVIETVLSIFDEVPALFGGFLDFLGAIFPYLPSEITMLLTFGVVAVVFIGIFKALRR